MTQEAFRQYQLVAGDKKMRSLSTIYLKIMRIVALVVKMTSLVLFALAVILVSVNVLLRYSFQSSVFWVNESSRYLMIWTSFLMIPILLREDKHLKVEVLFDKIGRRGQHLLQNIHLLLILVFSLFLADWGLRFAIEIGQLKQAGSIDIKMYWVYLIFPISGVLTGLFTIERLILLNTNLDVMIATGYPQWRGGE